MENIETGLLLMVVGMTTVFIILLIVINMSKGLIYLVNKYAPEEKVVKKTPPRPTNPTPPQSPSAVNPQTAAAIVSAVSVATLGKGKVIKIEKI